MEEIAVVGPDNGVGLTRDRNIVKRLLEEKGYKAVLINSHANVLEVPTKKYRVAIYLEVINPRYFRYFNIHVGIFNPDWFHPMWNSHLERRFKVALCKTKHSLNLFHCPTEYISFTSNDRWQENNDKDETTLLHVAGRSKLKGTEQLIHIWNKYNNLPKLKILSHSDCNMTHLVKTDNIDYYCNEVSDEHLKQVQNRYLFHIQPSEMEGFGHIINESCSIGANVITLDAPPMNELVTNESGYLIKSRVVGRHNIADRNHIVEKDLLRVVQNLVPDYEKSKLVRKQFLERNNFFENNFVNILERYI